MDPGRGPSMILVCIIGLLFTVIGCSVDRTQFGTCSPENVVRIAIYEDALKDAAVYGPRRLVLSEDAVVIDQVNCYMEERLGYEEEGYVVSEYLCQTDDSGRFIAPDGSPVERFTVSEVSIAGDRASAILTREAPDRSSSESVELTRSVSGKWHVFRHRRMVWCIE